MTLHIPRAPTAVARPYAGGSFRSPSEPVDWLPHALTFLEPLFQPELGLARVVGRHGVTSGGVQFQQLAIEPEQLQGLGALGRVGCGVPEQRQDGLIMGL